MTNAKRDKLSLDQMQGMGNLVILPREEFDRLEADARLGRMVRRMGIHTQLQNFGTLGCTYGQIHGDVHYYGDTFEEAMQAGGVSDATD